MIFVYEDDGTRQLSPLVHFCPVFDLLCGRRTLLEKFQTLYPRERLALLVRPGLAALTQELHPAAAVNVIPAGTQSRTGLFLSGRVIIERAIPVTGGEEVFVCGPEIVGFRVEPGRVGRLPLTRKLIRSWRLPERKVLASIVQYPWQIMEFNETELTRELRTERGRPIAEVLTIGNPRLLHVARTAVIQPGVVFDLTLGRISLADKCEVRAGSIVAGPCYVGPGTILDRALVRPGCSFGPQCRIGGEVEASVFQGYANKHHDGFIGHAVVGRWANLGALTTNSDLRNDYGEVKVTVGRRVVNTGLRKVGCIIGDHAKTAIGTLLNTGAQVGVFANWFEPGLSPKTIPDFAWGNRGRVRPADAVSVGRLVMSRRGVTMSAAYERLVQDCYAGQSRSRAEARSHKDAERRRAG